MYGTAVLGLAAAAEGADLYVAPGGNDAWTGRVATAAQGTGPFATLERARDEVRTLRQAGKLPDRDLVVELAEGTYELAKPFELTKRDSGNEGARIVYRAAKGQAVRLTGGRAVGPFTPVTEPDVLARLDPAARGKVVQTDLKARGITDFGEMGGGFGKGGGPGLELFFRDKPMTLARYPNEGFIRITSVQGPTERNVRGTKGCAEGLFTYEGDRPTRWAAEKQPWVLGYWFWDWAEGRHRVKSIAPDRSLIELEKPYHGYGYRGGQWFYGYNLLCEIDEPGEWYLDRETGVLYFWPPSSTQEGNAFVTVLPTVVQMKDVSHVTIEGVTIEGSRGTAVDMASCSDCEIATCAIRNVGSWAVQVRGGTRNSVVGCDIYATGDGGIGLTGGERKTLTPGLHLAENNHIHHWSRWNRMYRPAIHLTGVGLRARHNLIDNAPHTAIGFGGNEHLIELNEIHSVCHESNDAGAIYAGRDWTARGTVIRHNYMHHINGFEGRGCVGVYFDDMLSGNHIVGNLFYKVTRAAFIGGGRDCSIANNTFVECPRAIHIDARALGWAKGSVNGTMKTRLNAVPFKEEPWRSKYPQLLTLCDDEPGVPKGNVVARNISVGEEWKDIQGTALPHVRLEANLFDEDPHFVDPVRHNFQLCDDSPAFALGFERIPIENIGLYKDARRASWPAVDRVRRMAKPPEKKSKPLQGPKPVFQAPRRTATVTVDGRIRPEEWNGASPERAMVIGEGIHGEKVHLRSLAWIACDDESLWLAVDNTVDPWAPLRKGDKWGQDDAVEIALREPAAGKSAPIVILRGYPSGHFESSAEAGAPAAVVERAARGVEYAATTPDAGRWCAEWRVPLASLGIEPTAKTKLELNISVRKTGSSLWLMWHGTAAHTWDVQDAGTLTFAQ